jgi:hypothetical protein
MAMQGTSQRETLGTQESEPEKTSNTCKLIDNSHKGTGEIEGKEAETVASVARLLGKRGGDKTKQILGREHYVVMNRKSVESRRKKKLSTGDNQIT